MATMIRLHSSGRSRGRDGTKTESLTYSHKKNRMALSQVIGVACEAAPGHWQLCVRPNVVANAYWGSRRQGGGSVAEPILPHQACKMPSLLASPFSLNLHPWLPPTQLSTRGMYKQTWRVSLSIGMLHVTILCAIQVYRFFVMCQEIMNNHVFIYYV
jgi:hypothetical protein